MADEAQVSILKKGVADWNKWRKTNPEIRPDLSEANLRRADLGGADLRGTNLGRSDLSGANFFGSNLNAADLHAVWLWGANLQACDLCKANLRGAHLGLARLRAAKIDGADLADSEMLDTIFARVDLSKVRGLEEVHHMGPSTIGIDTIYRSGGNIPEAFLRGAGVPEPFIVQMKSLVAAMSPIEFYSCFISYSSKDHEFAQRLHADLQTKNVRCWFAPEDLKIGDKFRTRIEESIRVYDKLMVVLSEHSIQSPWVEEEVEAALDKERQQNKLVLFPIRLDDAVMETKQAWAASLRRTRHIGEFSNWKDHDRYKKAFDRLLRHLKAESTNAAGPED